MAADAPAEDWARIVCVVPRAVAELFDLATTRYLRAAGPLPTGSPEAVRNGIVLEAMVADFLAGPEQGG